MGKHVLESVFTEAVDDLQAQALDREYVLTQGTGQELVFDRPRVYGTRTTPVTGALTEDLEDARLGVIHKVYHTGATDIAVPESWILMGDAVYIPDELNVLYAEYTPDGVEYWIAQEG